MARWAPTAALIGALGLCALPVAAQPAAGSSATSRQAVAAPAAEPSPALAAPQAVDLRLVIDLQDDYSRAALRQLLAAIAAEPDPGAFAVHLHHLPLGRHAAARAAAAAAIAARLQGKELAFVRALIDRPALHSADLQAAALASGLDAERLLADRARAAVLDTVEHERRAAVAFGVRATPTALIGGRGLVGVVPAAVLRAALADARAAWARCFARGVRDCERDVVRRRAPAALAALTALRGRMSVWPVKSRGDDHGPASVRGSLGERWRVALVGDEPAVGAARPEVVAVAMIDVTDPDSPAQLHALFALAATRPWFRLVVLPIGEVEPGRGGADAEAVAANVALLAALRGATPAAVAHTLATLAQGPAPADSRALAARLGWSEQERSQRVGDTAATVAAERVVRLAVAVDGRPGALYIQGRRWLGAATDAGLDAALDGARGELTRGGRRGLEAYARLVETGRARDEAEIDLDGEEELGDLSFAVDLGSEAPAGVAPLDAWLFVDFTQPGSRAAFHALRLLRAHPTYPVRLRIASIASSAEPGVSPPSAALHVCARRGRALECTAALFAASDANDWTVLRRIVKRFGVKPTQLGEGASDAKVRAAMAAAASAARRLDMVDEPVIYLGDRRYLGPIDENRIVRAVAAAHRASLGHGGTTGGTP